MRKRGAFTDLFLFMILSFVIVFVAGVFIYAGTIITEQLNNELVNQSTAEVNYTTIMSETINQVPVAYSVLRWGTAVLIFGMIFSIFIGSYLVVTRPIFFVPYILIVLLAIVFAVVIANAYEEIISTPELADVFNSMTASTFLLLNLPIVVTIIGFVGGIIMFVSYKIGGGQEVYA